MPGTQIPTVLCKFTNFTVIVSSLGTLQMEIFLFNHHLSWTYVEREDLILSWPDLEEVLIKVQSDNDSLRFSSHLLTPVFNEGILSAYQSAVCPGTFQSQEYM